MNATHDTLTKEHRGMQYQISPAHPAANLFPWIEEVPLQELADSIAANGQEDDILMLPDGRIIDGRNREVACRIAGVGPRYSTVEMSEDDVLKLVVKKNIHRRNLTTGERALIGADLARMSRGRPKENGPQDAITQTRAAKLLGTSRKSVQRATVVQREAPELVDSVKAGKLDVCTAARVAVLPVDTRVKVATSRDPKAAAEAALRGSAGESPATEPSPITTVAVVKDERGRVIPLSLLPAFEEGWAVVKQIRATHRDSLQRLRDASTKPSGRGVAPLIPNVEGDYKKTAQDVAASVPWCCCPYVDESGKHFLGGDCKACVRNCGWLTRHNWHTLTDKVKKLIDEYAERSEPMPVETPAPTLTAKIARTAHPEVQNDSGFDYKLGTGGGL